MKGKEAQLFPDAGDVTRAARKEWEQQWRTMRTLNERIADSVPWWLIIVAAVFFLLSMPHTQNIMSQILPKVKVPLVGWQVNFGQVAPFGIEFGLLYVAFRKRQAAIKRRMDETQKRLPTVSYDAVLFALLFATSVLVNGVGSFVAAVANADSRVVIDGQEVEVKDLSFADLRDEFDNLPALTQAALLVAGLSALIIPIGTVVAGEGLAALFLEGQEIGSALEIAWQTDRAKVEYYALRDAALAHGHTPNRAIRWAQQISQYDPEASVPGHLSGMSAPDSPDESTDEDRDRRTAPSHATGQGYQKNMDARTAVQTALLDHPDWGALSVRQLSDVVSEHYGSVSKTTAADVLNEWRATHTNGNGHNNGSEA